MDHYPSAWVQPAHEAAEMAQQALGSYSGPEPEYRNSLEEIRTTTLIRAGLYEVVRLKKAAEDAKGSERKTLLQQALAKAEEVANLILTGKPRVNYLDCYGEGGFRNISAMIKKLAEELGLEVEDRYKAS